MQAKGLMPQESGEARKHPPAEPLGEIGYGITFSVVQEFVMLRDSFSVLPYNRKSKMLHGNYRQ